MQNQNDETNLSLKINDILTIFNSFNDNKQNKHIKIKIINLLKMNFMINPKLLKLMEGKYELLVQVNEMKEFVFLMQRILKDFFSNPSISITEKKQVTQSLFAEEAIPEVKILIDYLTEEDKTFMTTILNEFTILMQMLSTELQSQFEDGNVPMEYILQYSNHVTHTREEKKSLDDLLDPFYLEEHQKIVKIRDRFIQVLPKIPSHVMNEIMNYLLNQSERSCLSVFKEKIIQIDETEYDIDIEQLNKTDCYTIKEILMKHNCF